MSVLVRRLGRLRGAYPTLLRLDRDRVLGALPRRKRGTPSAAWTDPRRAQGFPLAPAANENKTYDSPEKIQENAYAHNLFLSSLKYAHTVMRPNTTYAYVTDEEALEILKQDWSSMTSAETVSAVKRLSYNICHGSDRKISPLRYASAFHAVNMQNLTNDELIVVMRHLVSFSSHMEKHSFYNDLCLRIDRECMMRFLRLSIDKTLYICDIMYQMMPKVIQPSCQYIWYSVRNLGKKPHKLNPQQLVQILFFLNICRKPPINMYELEFRLEECADELSMNELAVAALGFFKTSTKIRSRDFLIRIIRRTIKEIDTVHTVSIAAIIKLLRFSTTLAEVTIFLELLKVLTPYEPHYTLMTLAHIAQACGRLTVYDKELIDRIIGRLNKELKTARLKDFERLVYTFSILNIDSSNSIYQNIIEELRATWDTTRAIEITQFPLVASRILGYLSIQNIYPIDLIKRVMMPEYITKSCYGNYRHLSREYIVLDYSLRTEVPEYNGPFLKSSARDFSEKKYYDLALKTSSAESTRSNLLFTNILVTCQELFNTTSDISALRALPHFAMQDIVFCIDEQNQLMPSEKFLSQFEQGDIKRVDKENSNNVRWIALVIGHYGLLIRNCFTPTGHLAAKIRQLSVIGYTPIMISYISWEAFKSSQQKRDYIKNLVFRDNTSKLSNTI